MRDPVHYEKALTNNQERTKLFLHEYRNISKEAIRHDAKWLDKNLKVEVVQNVQLRRSLRGQHQSHTEKRAAMPVKTATGHTIFIAADQEGKPDLYQVGQAVCSLILSRHNQQSYFFFEPFLKLNLLELRARGYNVDRILRAKQEEARVAEEERRRALEAEAQRIKEREAEWTRQNKTAKEAESKRPKTPGQTSPGLPGAMPGAFGADSPEEKAPVRMPKDSRRSKGFFSNISRRFGIDKDEELEEQISKANEQMNNLLGGSDSGAKGGPEPGAQAQSGPSRPQGPGDSGRVTSPAVVQNNLLQAIRSTRPHDSSQVFSAPQTQEVKEQSTYCDSKPAQNIVFAAQAPRGMKVYLHRDISTDHMTFLGEHSEAITRFEALLRDIADIYGVSPSAIQIHFDQEGPCIAFNTNGSIFCNLRFFLQLHYNKIRDNIGRTAAEGRVEATVWWFVVVAHELAHNLVAAHDANHSYYTESFVQEYFAKMMAKAVSWTAAPAPAAPATVNPEGGRSEQLPPYTAIDHLS